MDGMNRSMRRPLVMLLVIASIAARLASPMAAQAPIDVNDLADYRLTEEVFKQFVQASRRIAQITSQDTVFTFEPLFTKDVALSGDAAAEASGLVARLDNHAGLTAALAAAKLTSREYSKFAIALVGAHLAHNFVKAGVLQRVPSGAPTINVEFVKAHESEVTAVLEDLGIHD